MYSLQQGIGKLTLALVLKVDDFIVEFPFLIEKCNGYHEMVTFKTKTKC